LKLAQLLVLHQVFLNVELDFFILRFVKLDLTDPRVLEQLGDGGPGDSISI